MTDGAPENKKTDGVSKKAIKKKKVKKNKAKEKTEPEAVMVVSEVVAESAKGKKKKKEKADLISQQREEETAQKLQKTEKKKEKKIKKQKKQRSSATTEEIDTADQERVSEQEKTLPHKRKKTEKSENGVISPKKKKKKAKKQQQLAEDPTPTEEKTEMPEPMTEELAQGPEGEEPTNNNQDASLEQSEAPLKRPFRRVANEDWIGKKGAWDNSYEATFGNSGWGAKAQQVLATVRGKNFRHEKTKKKRGTYFGGKISANAVRSIKFESDED